MGCCPVGGRSERHQNPYFGVFPILKLVGVLGTRGEGGQRVGDLGQLSLRISKHQPLSHPALRNIKKKHLIREKRLSCSKPVEHEISTKSTATSHNQILTSAGSTQNHFGLLPGSMLCCAHKQTIKKKLKGTAFWG